jgi:hypothetical protein
LIKQKKELANSKTGYLRSLRKIKTKQNKKPKRIRKSEESQWNTIKKNNLCMTGIQKEQRNGYKA